MLKIMNLFKDDSIVRYVAIVDYDGNIKTQMVLDSEHNDVRIFEKICRIGIKAIKGTKNIKNKFIDKTDVLIIPGISGNELIYFGNFIIYTYTNPTENEREATSTKKKIIELDKHMNHIFGSSKMEKASKIFKENNIS